MDIEYHTSISQKTWTVESGDPTKTITCGFWIKETVDRPFGSGKEGNGVKDYPYMPLSNAQNIRLFRLQPGRGSDSLRGSLVETKSNAFATSKSTVIGFEDKYEALSYTWGDASKRTKMGLDSLEISITTSLEAALLHVRSPNSEKVLWIDQICINQYDHSEKATQVQQMLRVYAAAERVHVWLGTSTEKSKVGMMLLQQLCDNRSVDGDPFWKDLPRDMVRDGIDDLITRQWFHRVWVVQEAAVAREVIMHCGKHQFFWRNTIEQVRFFSRSIKMAITLAAWAETHLKDVNIDAFLQVLQRQLDNGPESVRYKANLPAIDLLDIAYETRDRMTVDPRDRLHAMLGFADTETQQKLRPDYTMPVEEVFKRFEEVLLYQLHESGSTVRKDSQDGITIDESDLELWSDLGESWEAVHHVQQKLELVDHPDATGRIGFANAARVFLDSNRMRLRKSRPAMDSKSWMARILSLGGPRMG